MDPEKVQLSSKNQLDDSLEKQCLDFKKTLIEQAAFYRDENKKMEDLLQQLQLLNCKLNPLVQKQLDQLSNLQEKCDAKDCTVESIALSDSDCLRKQNNYIAKLRICIKMYTKLNERLTKQLSTIKYEHLRSNKKISSFTVSSDEEMQKLIVKISGYEKYLLKGQKKFPWINNPKLNLPAIAKEITALNDLRLEKNKLMRDLEVYNGLEPNLPAAKQQLASVKNEYEQMQKQFFQNALKK